jgi:hypothetical protein
MNITDRRKKFEERVKALMAETKLPRDACCSRVWKESPDLVGQLPQTTFANTGGLRLIAPVEFANAKHGAPIAISDPARRREFERAIEIEATSRGLDLRRPSDWSKCCQSVVQNRPELMPGSNVQGPAPSRQANK